MHNPLIKCFTSHCCTEPYEAVITEKGEWKLRCSKCKKDCAALEEKYSIKPDLFKY